jgi:hypothetical protein
MLKIAIGSLGVRRLDREPRIRELLRRGCVALIRFPVLLIALVSVAVPFGSNPAGAQTTKTLSVGLASIGSIPSGVTGVNIIATCDTADGPGPTEVSAAFFLQNGQTANLTNFALSPAARQGLGSVCRFRADVAGTANTSVGLMSMTVAGSPITVYPTYYEAANGTGGASAISAPTVSTSLIKIVDSTSVKVTLTYNPSLSWKTFGNVPANVTGYQLSANCADSAGTALPTAIVTVAVGTGSQSLVPVSGADRCSYSLTLLGSGASVNISRTLYIDDVNHPFLGVGQPDARGWLVYSTAQSKVSTPGAARLEIDFVGNFGVEVSADSVSPTGQPFEVSVACDKGGPKEVLSLNPGDRKIYLIATGTTCLVTETNSRGATVSYIDNSGANTADGRVLVGTFPSSGCPSFGSQGVSLTNPSCLIGVSIRNAAPIATPAAVVETTTSTTTEVPATTTTTTSVAPTLVFLPIPVVTVAPTSAAPASSVPATTLPTVVQTSIPVTTTSAPKPEATTAVTVAPNTTTTQPARTSVVTKSWTKRGLKPGSVVLVKTLQGKTVVRGLARANGSISLELPVGKYSVVTVMPNGRKLTIRISVL